MFQMLLDINVKGLAETHAKEPLDLNPTCLTCPIGGAPIGGIIPGGSMPGGIGVMLGGRCPIGGIPMGGK